MVKNWIEIESKKHVTGPAQMLRELHEHFPVFDQADILFVWLDENDLALGIDQLVISESETDVDLEKLGAPPAENCQKLIVVCRASTKALAAESAEKYKDLKQSPLDVLLVSQTHWWSNLCTNAECCPNEGRPLPAPKSLQTNDIALRHEKWLSWLNLFNKFSVQYDFVKIEIDDEQFLRESVDDLAIRDCILNHLSINPGAQIVWNRIFERFLTSENTLNNHVFNCLIAAIHFSTGDLNLADKFTKNSLLINPDYSLSLLMQHGLEIKMDCKKIVSAFTHFTSEELLKNTPLRK